MDFFYRHAKKLQKWQLNDQRLKSFVTFILFWQLSVQLRRLLFINCVYIFFCWCAILEIYFNKIHIPVLFSSGATVSMFCVYHKENNGGRHKNPSAFVPEREEGLLPAGDGVNPKRLDRSFKLGSRFLILLLQLQIPLPSDHALPPLPQLQKGCGCLSNRKTFARSERLYYTSVFFTPERHENGEEHGGWVVE